MRTTSFWFLVGFQTTQIFAFGMLAVHQVAFLMDMGIGAGVAATVFSLLPGMMTVGKLSAGFLGLHFNVRAVAFSSTVLMVAGMTMLLVGSTLPVIFAATTCFGLGAGAALVSLVSLLPMYFGPKNFPKIMGFLMPLPGIIGGLGMPFAGILFDLTGSYLMPFSIGILVLIGGLLCLLAPPPRHPSLKASLLEA